MRKLEHTGQSFRQLAYSPNGNTLAIVQDCGPLFLWTLENAKQIEEAFGGDPKK